MSSFSLDNSLSMSSKLVYIVSVHPTIPSKRNVRLPRLLPICGL